MHFGSDTRPNSPRLPIIWTFIFLTPATAKAVYYGARPASRAIGDKRGSFSSSNWCSFTGFQMSSCSFASQRVAMRHALHNNIVIRPLRCPSLRMQTTRYCHAVDCANRTQLLLLRAHVSLALLLYTQHKRSSLIAAPTRCTSPLSVSARVTRTARLDAPWLYLHSVVGPSLGKFFSRARLDTRKFACKDGEIIRNVFRDS